jgi:aldose 1-epimerase
MIYAFFYSIGQGRFTVDGKDYQLAINNGPNALHGGLEGFDKRIWTATVLSQQPASIRLELVSEDGDQGYPGKLTTQVTYTVTDKDELSIEYHATTDKDTVVNLTNHSYFNLAGVVLNPKILDHRVTMTDEVTAVLETDSDSLPTGKVLSWSEVPWMDFSVSSIIILVHQCICTNCIIKIGRKRWFCYWRPF